MEFECEILPGFTTKILREIQNIMDDIQCGAEECTGRMIFVSMFNDIERRNTRNKNVCVMNSTIVSENVRKFPLGHWSFLGPKRCPVKKDHKQERSFARRRPLRNPDSDTEHDLVHGKPRCAIRLIGCESSPIIVLTVK